MNKLYQYKSLALELKDVNVKQGIISGYFASFNTPDSDKDIIRKGAFVRSITENGPASNKPRIKHLLNHDPSQPLGSLISLKEDDYGLSYESQIGTHNLGQDFLKMVDSGLIKEHSIGYVTVKRNQIGDWQDPACSAVYELTELKLYEGSSLTAWGANENTPLTGVKSLTTEAMKSRIEKLEKFCRNATASDECIELLLLEIKQLGQLLSTSSTLPAAEAVATPKGIELMSLQAAIESQKLTLQNLI